MNEWQNLAEFLRCQQTAVELWELLHTLAGKGLFDDDFKRSLQLFKSLNIDKSRGFYLEAGMYCALGDYVAAETAIREALRLRKIDARYWHLMAEIQEHLGNRIEAYFYKALQVAHGEDGVIMEMPITDKQAMKAISLAMTSCAIAPHIARFVKNEQGLAERKNGNLVGDYLTYKTPQGYTEYCGIYNPFDVKEMRSDLCDKYSELNFMPSSYCNIAFEIIPAVRQQVLTVNCPPGRECVVPLATEEARQTLTFVRGDMVRNVPGGKREFSFFRFSPGETKVCSKNAFQVGKPVWLGHAGHRRRLVLNIFVDGLPWQVIKARKYQDVPNIMAFFRPGVIFDNTFSASEFTYPSVATIETGFYPYHTQAFNETVMLRIDEQKKTTSEYANELGYYCAMLMGDCTGVYNGALRGVDRKIVQLSNCRGYEAIERCIRHLDAFSEADNYVYIHMADAHPYPSYAPATAYTQVKLPLEERTVEDSPNSVFMLPNMLNNTDNLYLIRSLDSQLQQLFSYVQTHYAEHEFIVNLYSDHGVSIYDKERYLLSEFHTGSALMLRGAGVPARGLVQELTSTADIHPIMGHLLGFSPRPDIDGNLPAVFGGRQRPYAVSMSIYLDQTFKFCVRDREYEFRLETEKNTTVGGLADMSAYTTHIYRRRDRKEIYDDNLLQQFMFITWQHIKDFAINGGSFQENGEGSGI